VSIRSAKANSRESGWKAAKWQRSANLSLRRFGIHRVSQPKNMNKLKTNAHPFGEKMQLMNVRDHFQGGPGRPIKRCLSPSICQSNESAISGSAGRFFVLRPRSNCQPTGPPAAEMKTPFNCSGRQFASFDTCRTIRIDTDFHLNISSLFGQNYRLSASKKRQTPTAAEFHEKLERQTNVGRLSANFNEI
jgi:hypothetical protein